MKFSLSWKQLKLAAEHFNLPELHLKLKPLALDLRTSKVPLVVKMVGRKAKRAMAKVAKETVRREFVTTFETKDLAPEVTAVQMSMIPLELILLEAAPLQRSRPGQPVLNTSTCPSTTGTTCDVMTSTSHRPSP